MRSLDHLLRKEAKATNVDELTTDGLLLLNFLTLLVDISYRAKYGTGFEPQRGRGYSKPINDKVLPDQTRSVDSGLEGLPSTESV